MDGCGDPDSVFCCRRDENIFQMIVGIFWSQNAHFGTKKGVFRVILLNVALKVYLNRFKVDGCRVSDSVFHCRRDTNIFKMIFDIFGSQNAHFGTKKGVFRVILLNVALKVHLNRFKVDGCGVSDSVFCCRRDEIFFKMIFDIFGSQNALFGTKYVFLESFYLTLP